MCPNVLFLHRISALLDYRPKSCFLTEYLPFIGVSAQYQIICPKFKYLPYSAVAAAAAAAENLKNVNPPFNPCLYSPNHSFLYIYIIKNDECIHLLLQLQLLDEKICPKVVFS